jgi:hypothetical protein
VPVTVWTVFKLLSNALDEVEVFAVKKVLVHRAVLRDLLPRVAVDAIADTVAEGSERGTGKNRVFAAMRTAVIEAFCICDVVNLLHLFDRER